MWRSASPAQWRKLLAYGVLIGVIAGIGALAFNWMLAQAQLFFLERLAHYIPPGLPSEGGKLIESIGSAGRWFVPLVSALGGLIAGLIVFTLAPEAEGHGTDAVIRAYHHSGGAIRGRVPVIKTVASAITIGSGGSGGREGPIAQIGAGIGSVLATVLRLGDVERRILVMAGAAGGIGAIFHAPLGGALFVTEVLYRRLEYETEILVPSIVSSVTAYSILGYFYGFGPLFTTSGTFFHDPILLPLYLVLGIIATGAALLFIRMFDQTTRLFKRLPLPRVLKPAVGGLLVGTLGIFLPQVLNGGYGWMQMVFLNQLPMWLLLIAAFGKMVATSLSIGSGGSGGVFGPSVLIGAMLGGAVGQGFQLLFPALPINPVDFALVGMAAFFAAAAKTPLSSIVMVTEMTGSYGLLVPLMLAGFISYVLSGLQETLYRSQVPDRLESPVHAHRYIRMAFQRLRDKGAPLPSDIPLPDLANLLKLGQPVPISGTGDSHLYALTLEPAYPIVGKTLQESRIPPEVLVAAIIRDGKVIVPHGSTILRPGDRLILATNASGMSAFKRWLKAPPVSAAEPGSDPKDPQV